MTNLKKHSKTRRDLQVRFPGTLLWLFPDPRKPSPTSSRPPGGPPRRRRWYTWYLEFPPLFRSFANLVHGGRRVCEALRIQLPLTEVVCRNEVVCQCANHDSTARSSVGRERARTRFTAVKATIATSSGPWFHTQRQSTEHSLDAPSNPRQLACSGCDAHIIRRALVILHPGVDE